MPRTAKVISDGQERAWPDQSLNMPRYSQSLERGLAILGCFTPSRPILGIADIADELGMGRSTTHRYVLTLKALGYLDQGTNRKYRLGLRVTELGMSALNSTGIREHAHPDLEALRIQTDYPVSLCVLDGTEVLVVDRLRSFRRQLRDNPQNLSTASRLPVYCSAAGKLLLSHLPPEQRNELIAALKITKHGPNSIASKRELSTKTAILGPGEGDLGTDNEELASEMYAIAAPVRDESKEVVAAVELAAHSTMISLETLVEALGPHLVATADRVSARLGFRRDDERP